MYRSTGYWAETICHLIGWNYDVRPIKVLRRSGVYYVTGTLLKPEEWRNLKRNLPNKAPDGSKIVLTGYPL